MGQFSHIQPCPPSPIKHKCVHQKYYDASREQLRQCEYLRCLSHTTVEAGTTTMPVMMGRGEGRGLRGEYELGGRKGEGHIQDGFRQGFWEGERREKRVKEKTLEKKSFTSFHKSEENLIINKFRQTANYAVYNFRLYDVSLCIRPQTIITYKWTDSRKKNLSLEVSLRSSQTCLSPNDFCIENAGSIPHKASSTS